MQIVICQRDRIAGYWLLMSFLACLFFAHPGLAFADVSVSANGLKVEVETDSGVDRDADNVAEDVEMEGVAIINGKVYVDGELVPKGKREVTSRKSGKTYRINRGKDGNVTVTEK